MRSGGPRVRRQAQRRTMLAALCAVGIGPTVAEPLVLRVRVRAEPGSITGARAAGEAVWARSHARARAVIASVCTGCLGAWPDAGSTAPAPDPSVRFVAARPEAALPEPAGLEQAPAPGASDEVFEPPIRERRP